MTPYVAKMMCFTVKIVAPAAPPPKRQHYRGFDHLGRWGPRSGRPGHRPPGKTRYFRNDLGSFPGREAGSVWETHNTLEESTSRMASGAVIYGISGGAVLRIRNTIEKVTSRIAKVTCFIVEIVAPAGPPPENDDTIEDSAI